MRKIALVALATMMLASAAFAQSTTSTTSYSEVLYPAPDGSTGANWIAMKGVPINPDPIAVFGDVALIDGFLARLISTAGGTETYFSFQEPGGPFGNMLLGEGYWVNVGDGQQHTITYTGIANGVPDAAGAKTDMWISLPGVTGAVGGMHWIGNPFNENIPFVNIKVTDGTQTIPVADAIAAGWLDGLWGYLDAANQGTLNVDPDGIYGSTDLEPGKMYQVFTRKSNIALIIPANP